MRHTLILFCVCAALAIAAPSQDLTTLVSFNGDNGAYPVGTLVQGTDGNLYGTTKSGGTANSGGTVFQVTPNGTLTILHSFGSQQDGAEPLAGLVQAADGNFYGTTLYGGTGGYGTVFKVTSDGSLSTLHSFAVADGYQPYARLIQGADGNFYGTTVYGGSSNSGTAFQITPGGTLATLHGFRNLGEGRKPYAGLVQATDGNFYGTTREGGSAGYGTVFKITPQGTLTTLHNFDYADGAYPYAELIQATDGNFYGVTYYGGANDQGTVFRITPDGTLTVLHNFICTDGLFANGLIQAADGNLYGTTMFGGNTQDCLAGCGTIFRISPQGGELTTLYSFSGSDGAAPSGLVEVTDGEFYGTTGSGGAFNDGTVFRLVAGAVLSVMKSGLGTVTSGDGYIHCGNTCAYTYLGGSQVGLTALPAPGYTFSSWTGCDNVQGDICVVKMSSARNVTAAFDVAQITLTSLTFNPSYVKGGRLSAGTLTLSAPAPPGGLGVALSSDHPSVAHPPSLVLVPGGKSSIVFGVNTFPVKTNTTVTITATAGASQVSGTLTVGTGYSQSAK